MNKRISDRKVAKVLRANFDNAVEAMYDFKNELYMACAVKSAEFKKDKTYP